MVKLHLHMSILISQLIPTNFCYRWQNYAFFWRPILKIFLLKREETAYFYLLQVLNQLLISILIAVIKEKAHRLANFSELILPEEWNYKFQNVIIFGSYTWGIRISISCSNSAFWVVSVINFHIAAVARCFQYTIHITSFHLANDNWLVWGNAVK